MGGAAVGSDVDVSSPVELLFFEIGTICGGSAVGMFSPANAR